MDPVDALRVAYQPLIVLAGELDDTGAWAPTELPGWSVRDLVLHLAHDAQRALVALATPAFGPADTDEVTYWCAWRPGTEGARSGLRGTRIMASAWSSARGPADLYAETARAVLVQAARSELEDVVVTQGRRLTVESLLRTLVVEAAVHHLDLGLPEPPAAGALAEVRHVLDGLLGSPLPAHWDDVRCALVGTGRAPLSADERAELGSGADRFPLFG
jgi:hypothetical protein